MKPKRSETRYLRYLTGALAISVLSAGNARANTDIIVEAVDSYTCSTPLMNSISGANGFRNAMLSRPGFTGGAFWVDPNVWDIDFRDPQASPFTGDDSNGFDPVNGAIGYFSGHGECTDQRENPVSCTTFSNCPARSGRTAICTRFTENPLSGVCMYSAPRVLELQSSRGADICTLINLSTADVRFGDSPTSNQWAGVGANGNINLAVLDISCGSTPDMEPIQYNNAFAGTALIATIMPTRKGSDTYDTNTRGPAFANQYVANPNGSVGSAWLNALNATTGGAACQFGGGGHGISGCGAVVVMSRDESEATAQWDLNTESWVDLRNESLDTHGGTVFASKATCNYDCFNHPWHLW